ncbi:helix-turn-helix domain-containing protein [Amycolatopsis aidingensis]|uniref:helix-turn-helix domain-containing protein n=1 Tax=Amycolatopsis aidingensis TaxID=2842453 RepID=UPI001C0E1E8E|nr:helix-turn-helix transcriptional regulator [Amycolatopsis aidingensis]
MISELTLGRKIELMRRRRGLSRQALAALVGYSAEWLRQVEKDQRRPDKLSALLRVADVLRVDDVASFLGVTTATPTAGPDPRTASAAIRKALFGMTGPGDGGTEQATVTDQLRTAWSDWRDARWRYSVLQHRLPWLLTAASALAGPATGRDAVAQHRAVAEVHRLAAAFLSQVNDLPLALLTAERAVASAAQTGDPAVHAACEGGLAAVLLRLGRIQESADLCRTAAGRLGTDTPSGPRSAVATWGAVHLTAATVSAAAGEQLTAYELLDRARAAAARLPSEDTVPGCSCGDFGRAAVDVQGICLEVILGHTRRALRTAARVDLAEAEFRSTRSRYYLTLARAHARQRDAAAATFALLRTERVSPEEVVFNSEARDLIQLVLRQDDATVRHEMWRLAERARLV